MSLPIVLRLEASQDAEETQDFLETQSAGLGHAFVIRLKDTLNQISAMPQMYGEVWRSVRAAKLRRFTYVVYYRVHDDRVEVLAVMHGSRDASAWRTRA